MSSHILKMLRERGFRITRARSSIVEVFTLSPTPLSVPELKAILARKGVVVNKTTVYREVEFLKGEKMIREIQIGDGMRRYEAWPKNHHHHLVCVDCKRIECFELERCLEALEQRISKEKKFDLIKHSLEFFGRCSVCQ